MRSFFGFAIIALGLLASSSALAGDKVDICHVKGNGESVMINISEVAVEAHVAHGDSFGQVFCILEEDVLIWEYECYFNPTNCEIPPEDAIAACECPDGYVIWAY